MSYERWDVAYSSSSDVNLGGGYGKGVRWLVGINVTIYFLQLVVFGSTNAIGTLGLNSATFPQNWWTAGTYMFVHAGLMHVGLNMFMLWMFGSRLEAVMGTRSFVYFYLWCGLGGAVMYMLFAVDGSMVVGASGAVVGVVLAYALRWPTQELYIFGLIPMKARWLAIWMIVWNITMALANLTGYTESRTAWMAHVGGLVFAWIFLHAPRSMSLDGIRRHVSSVPDETDVTLMPPRRARGSRPNNRRSTDNDDMLAADEVVELSKSLFPFGADSFTDEVEETDDVPDNYPDQSSPTPKKIASSQQIPGKQHEIDRLLDKISREGLASLTSEERLLLQELSRRLGGQNGP